MCFLLFILSHRVSDCGTEAAFCATKFRILMRQTFNISLPEDMSHFVRERVTAFDFASVSEYFRHLVRQDRHRLAGGKEHGADLPPVRSFDTARDPVTGRWR